MTSVWGRGAQAAAMMVVSVMGVAHGQIPWCPSIYGAENGGTGLEIPVPTGSPLGTSFPTGFPRGNGIGLCADRALYLLDAGNVWRYDTIGATTQNLGAPSPVTIGLDALPTAPQRGTCVVRDGRQYLWLVGTQHYVIDVTDTGALTYDVSPISGPFQPVARDVAFDALDNSLVTIGGAPMAIARVDLASWTYGSATPLSWYVDVAVASAPDGTFQRPEGVAIGPDGDLYAAVDDLLYAYDFTTGVVQRTPNTSTLLSLLVIDLAGCDVFFGLECLNDAQCDDGMPCSEDTCNAGTCVHTPDDLLCNDGNGCTADSCDGGGACVHAPVTVGTPCGNGASSACDLPDTCDLAGVCQPNGLPDGTECRGVAGTCDVAETCLGGVCPSDVVVSAGTPCRAAADGCDAPEACDGVNGACPADVPAPDGTVCTNECALDGECVDGACRAVTAPIVARSKAILKERTRVETDLIVDSPKGKAKLLLDATMADDTILKAHKVLLLERSSVFDVETNVLKSRGTVRGSESSFTASGNLDPCPLAPFTCGGSDVAVPPNTTMALAPGTYRNVIVGAAAVLELTEDAYVICQIILESLSAIHVVPGPAFAEVQVQKITTANATTIQPIGGASRPRVWVSIRAAFGLDTTLITHLFAPRATLKFRDRSVFDGRMCTNTLITLDDVVLACDTSRP